MTSRRIGKRPRRGYTLVEIAVAALLLMAAMSITVKALGWVARERRSADRRQWAAQEVSNVMEQLTAEPFEKLNTARAREITLASKAERVLPGASWQVEIVNEARPDFPGKRLSLLLRWKDRVGEWGAPVRLTSWVFGRGKSS
jgi:hypothetical protein